MAVGTIIVLFVVGLFHLTLITNLRGESLHKDSHQKIEQDIVAKRHESNKI